MRAYDLAKRPAFLRKSGRPVARHPGQEDVLAGSQCPHEKLSSKAAHYSQDD